MSIERTLSIIKPNATAQHKMGAIMNRFEDEGLFVVAAKLVKLSKEKAEGFYIEHKERPFFNSLISFMTSGPVLIMALEGNNAIQKNREIMGSTNPKEALPNTLRKLFGEDIEKNAVHGSDSMTSAQREISYFFDKNEIVSY